MNTAPAKDTIIPLAGVVVPLALFLCLGFGPFWSVIFAFTVGRLVFYSVVYGIPVIIDCLR